MPKSADVGESLSCDISSHSPFFSSVLVVKHYGDGACIEMLFEHAVTSFQ